MHRFVSRALLAALLVSPWLPAQGLDPIGRVHPNAVPLAQVPAVAVPALDRQAIALEDENRHLARLPARYAIPNTVDVRPETHGRWEALDATWSLWRLRIQAPEASHVNLGFTQAVLPGTARLMVYSADYQNTVRPFDASDVSATGQLWTPIVGSAEIVVEVYVTTAQRPQLQLHLTHVGSGYRFFGAGNTANVGVDGGSGGCNIDVVCGASAGWETEIPSVAAISSGGSIFCSGCMINNTAQDGRDFFLTAEHCGVNATTAASLVCYWNYQRAVCGSGTGPLTMFNTGSWLRASFTGTDVTLVELVSSPNPAWGVTYAGWSREMVDATSACGVHHPSGDDKKICFEQQPTTVTTYLGTSVPGDSTHIRVEDWDLGVTEPGSSGSPLFNQNHQVIGQLHGGYSACGNNLSDYYGRFAISWTGGGTSATRLSDWLDPLSTGQTTLGTRPSTWSTTSVYGTGCNATFATFFEQFAPGTFDLSGTATASVVVRFQRTATGYQVQPGTPGWYTPTTPNLNLGDEECSSMRAMPFTLNFLGGAVAGVKLSSNGFVWLGAATTDPDPTPSVVDLCSAASRFAPLWMDLDPSAGGTMHFDLDPSNQAAYCTWIGVPARGGTAGNTFQVVLRSSGDVEFRYRVVAGQAHTAIVGFSPGNGALEPVSHDLSASMPFSLSADVTGLMLVPVGRPVQGQSFTMNIDNIPPSSFFVAILLGWAKIHPGVDLGPLGMPGCFRYCSPDGYASFFTGGSQFPITFPIPTGTYWAGMRLYGQAAAIDMNANALGALSSNGVEMLFNLN